MKTIARIASVATATSTTAFKPCARTCKCTTQFWARVQSEVSCSKCRFDARKANRAAFIAAVGRGETFDTHLVRVTRSGRQVTVTYGKESFTAYLPA